MPQDPASGKAVSPSASAMHRKKQISHRVMCFYPPSVKSYFILVSADTGIQGISRGVFQGLVSGSKELTRDTQLLQASLLREGNVLREGVTGAETSVAQIMPPLPVQGVGAFKSHDASFGGICIVWAFPGAFAL